MQLTSFTWLPTCLWIFAIAFPKFGFSFEDSYELEGNSEDLRVAETHVGNLTDADIDANTETYNSDVEGKVVPRNSKWNNTLCYVKNTDSYTNNNGWRHEDDCRGIQMLDCKCHEYSTTRCYNYKDNLLNCINQTTEYMKADRSCSQYSINKPDLIRSYDLILNLLMEPLKMYFRSVESRLSFLSQATFAIDSLSNIAGLRCSTDLNDGECGSGIDQLLSEEEALYNEMRTNFTLELFKIQNKIHTTSTKVDKLKQGTFDTINRAIKEYSCCLKSLDFSVDDYDCSNITNIYPTTLPECGCDPLGSFGPTCNSEGSCSCKPQFEGKLCNSCKDGYYNYPLCAECDCDTRGSSNQTCNSEGQCYCKPEIEGKKCDKCRNGFYYYPECTVLTTPKIPVTTMRSNARSRCSSSFTCRKSRWEYGTVPCSYVCDGSRDCNDGTDENDC
ncbi:hypothetical protein GE061_004616 [Apolygus lucorum]|uniref:Laminin EGF-like domain-containing protein n=1 Tax=Apolygus lucorum TaxID=248454 RepID=A0A8S9X1H0_APOLU|nr:hypothetical protein GE061_004616 [Apolygus lucorum]